MEFKQDTRVYTSDGQVVGHVDRVVLDPKTKAVSHIVVRKGFLFVEDKVVPLDVIASADAERVTLRAAAVDLEKLLPFEESHYVPLNADEAAAAAYAEGLADPLYWYPPIGGWLGHDYLPPYGVEIEQNIPEDTVAVIQGARVVTADDKEVGHVEQVFTDPATNRATYLLITHGFLTKTKKLIPTTWIRKVAETEIELSVGSSIVDDLHEYQPT